MNYTSEKRGLYRSRRSLLFGVCRGVAEYLDISVFWTRVVVFVACVLTGFWPVGAAYLLAALLLKREPGVRVSDWRPAIAETVRACRRAAGTLDERLHRLQTAMDRDMAEWDARLRENR